MSSKLREQDKSHRNKLINESKDITKKQHFLSQFLIKNWANSSNDFYKIFNRDSKEIKEIGLNSNEDIFYDIFFYEQENLKINEIEKILSVIEDAFSKLTKKIITWKTANFQFNAKEMVLIYCWYYIQNIRTESWRETRIKNWQEYWSEQKGSSPDTYLKFYRDINQDIIDLYNNLYLPFQNKVTRKDVINLENYNKWYESFLLTMTKKQELIDYDVVNKMKNIFSFNEIWIEYESMKYKMSSGYLKHMYFFFYFFKPMILKTNKNHFILTEQIFEDTNLNGQFLIHNIPISPNHSIGFISGDMDFYKSTKWPEEIVKFKDMFSKKNIVNQIYDLMKENHFFKTPIIYLNDSQVKNINNSLLLNSTNKDIIIPWNYDKTSITNILDYSFENNTSESKLLNKQVKLLFDYEGRYIVTNKNGRLSNQEFIKYLEERKGSWFNRLIRQESGLFPELLNRCRFVLLIEHNNELIYPPVLFGKLNKKWFFSLDYETWDEFSLIENEVKDMRILALSLINTLSITLNIKLTTIDKIIITDDVVKTKFNNYHYFTWELLNNNYYLEEVTFHSEIIRDFDFDYFTKYCNDVLNN